MSEVFQLTETSGTAIKPLGGDFLVRRISPGSEEEQDIIILYRSEIDDYLRQMTQLNSIDMSEVFQKLSAFSARGCEMRTQIVRIDSRKANAFRTRELDPFIDECERQFRIHSRLMSLREMEWNMANNKYA